MIAKKTIHTFFRFVLGGALVFFMKTVFTYLFTEYIGLTYTLSYALVLTTTAVAGYFYHVHITYRSTTAKKSFYRYIISLALFYLADWILVIGLTELLNLHYLLSITLVTIVLFFAKFFVFGKIFIPRKRPL